MAQHLARVMKAMKASQIARLSQLQLAEIAAEHGLVIDRNALDLEIRAMVARLLSGGDQAGSGAPSAMESFQKDCRQIWCAPELQHSPSGLLVPVPAVQSWQRQGRVGDCILWLGKVCGSCVLFSLSSAQNI